MGRLEEARREPSPLAVGPHLFEPSITWKLFDVTTPHVFGALDGGYNDNVLREDPQSPGSPARETFGRVEAGTRLDTELSDHRLELEYRLRVTEYTESGDHDTFEQSAKARLDLFFNDVSFHGDMGYQRHEYPQSIQLRGIVRLDEYTFNAWGEAGFAKVTFRLGAYGSRLEYRQRENRDLDLETLGGNAQAALELFPKLHGLLEYNLTVVRHVRGRRGTLNDYLLHQVWGGLRGELTPKLTASLKFGLAILDAQRGPNPDRRDYLGVSGEGSISWQPLVNTTLTLIGQRSLAPSTNSNFLLTDSVRFQVRQTFLDETLRVQAFVSYAHARVRPGRHLNQVKTGAQGSWQIRDWLSLAATYEFENLISGFPLSDYRVNVVTISAGVGF